MPFLPVASTDSRFDQLSAQKLIFDYILPDDWFGSKAKGAFILNDFHKLFIINIQSNRTLGLSG